MNALRTRILCQMLFLGLGPLTVFALGLRFLPGGLLPWLWYLALIVIASVAALFFSGRAARPLKEGISAFRGLIHPDRADVSRSWVPKEFWAVREEVNELFKDLKSNNTALEISLAQMNRTVKAAERAAIRSLEVLHGIIESTPDGVVFTHSDGHIALINQKCIDLFDLSEEQSEAGADGQMMLAQIASQFQDSAALANQWVAWQQGPAGMMEGEWVTAGARARAIIVRTFGIRGDEGEHLGRVWIFKDSTEERQLTRRLQDTQKLESMGQLAGGIAHDFNNLLTAIRGSLSLAQLDGVDVRQRQEHLDNATRAAARATELVGKILGYSSGKHAANDTTCNVRKLLTELQSLMRASLDPCVKLHCQVMDESWLADIPHVQLEQVLLNLLFNARDALGAEGGSIKVHTSHYTIAESQPGQRGPVGDYLVVHVRDTGSGIPEEVRGHLFEAFFTTKEPGKGTGLGLATSHALVKEVGGWIEFETEMGKGTEFRVFLPRAAVLKPTAAPAVEVKPTIPEKSQRGTEEGVILVVDDEAPVRSIAVNMLKYLGYRVIEASDGETALKLLEEIHPHVDAIMLDVHMPRLSGRETFVQVREMGIDVPVIVCSGFMVEASDFKQATRERGGSVVVLQKPYSMETLASVVRNAVQHTHQALPA